MNASNLAEKENVSSLPVSPKATSRLSVTDPRIYMPGLGVGLLVLLPLMLGENSYYTNLLCLILLFASAGMAWNILGGYARQVSLGHALFFGIGAYTSTLLQIHWKISPWIGMVAGGVLAVLIGFVIGMGVFRLRGHYFAIATIAFSMITMLVFVKFYQFTGGAQGLSVPFENSFWMLQFKGKLPYYYIFLVMMLGMIFLVRKIQRSRLGYYMVAMGQDEQAAKAIGINIPRVKHTALAISAFCTAITGTLYAQFMYFIEPLDIFSIPMSVEFALVSIVGGLGTVLGPVLGAFVMKPIVEITNEQFGSVLPGLNFAIYGIILILVIILRPNGLIGIFSDGYHYLLSKLPGYGKNRKAGEN